MNFTRNEIINCINELDDSTTQTLLKIYKLKYIAIDDDTNNLLISTSTNDKYLIILPDVMSSKNNIELINKILKEAGVKYIELKNKNSYNSSLCNSGVVVQLIK